MDRCIYYYYILCGIVRICVCARTIDDKSTRSPRRKNSGKNVDVVERQEEMCQSF